MNCPKCLNGVVEVIGYMELKEGPIEFVFAKLIPEEMPAVTVELCSRTPCDYVTIGAAPESLSLAKRILKDKVLAHRKLP